MRNAPLFVRGYDLYSWLLDRLDAAPAAAYASLRRTVLDHARDLIEAILLALRGGDPLEHLIRADASAALLRMHLRLAEEKSIIESHQYRFAVESLDDIGRQLGGWLKKRDRL